MEVLQVRQRSSGFDRISNRVSILEWKEYVNRVWLAGGRVVRGSGSLKSGSQGEGCYNSQWAVIRAWLVEWTEVTTGGKTTEQWKDSYALKSSATFSETNTGIQGWQIHVYSWNNWGWIIEGVAENETYEDQSICPGREQRLIINWERKWRGRYLLQYSFSLYLLRICISAV